MERIGCRAWSPPATLVCGLALAAGRGPIAGAAVAAWAGLLHAAATAGSAGLAIAASAILVAALRLVGSNAARRWALAGPLGWAAATALAAANLSLNGGGPTVDWTSLPAALGIALIGAGLAAASGDSGAADRDWR